MAIESVDLWGHVQKYVFDHPSGQHLKAEPTEPPSNVRLLPSTDILHLVVDDNAWHGDRFHHRADELFTALELAVAKGQTRKADRLRVTWLHQVHLDRVAWARETARERGLRMDPIGRGPIVDSPCVHMRDRLPWYLTPVGRYRDRRLPDRASEVLDTWNGSGGVFDSLYVADEPVSSGHFPTHSLVGAISVSGHAADWFVLDRWAS
ncbi:MAG: hypothetical protein WD826_08945 [Actinomycetota bacterium]